MGERGEEGVARQISLKNSDFRTFDEEGAVLQSMLSSFRIFNLTFTRLCPTRDLVFHLLFVFFGGEGGGILICSYTIRTHAVCILLPDKIAKTTNPFTVDIHTYGVNHLYSA